MEGGCLYDTNAKERAETQMIESEWVVGGRGKVNRRRGGPSHIHRQPRLNCARTSHAVLHLKDPRGPREGADPLLAWSCVGRGPA